MGFLNNIFLWSGLAALGIALPVVIHLLNRLHRKTTDWAAIELLRRATIIRSRQLKMEDIIILILRCLTLVLIALAMARPTLRASTGLWFGGQRTGIVVGLDASYSMQHGKFNPRLADAQRRVRDILSTATPGDPISLTLLGTRPRILLNRAAYDRVQVDRLLKDHAEALPEGLDIEAGLEELERLVAELKTPTRECYIVTDAQGISWNTLSDSARATLDRIRKAANIFLVPLTIEDEENLGVTRLAFTSGTLRETGVGRFTAEVRNFGRRPLEGAAATLEINGQPVSRRALGLIGPGEAQSMSFLTTFAQSGPLRITVRLSPDALVTDNTRHMVLTVPKQIRVLCVDGRPDEVPSLSESYFLRRALLPRRDPNTPGPIIVDVVHWQDLSRQEIETYDVVILANLADISVDETRRLFEYTCAGGGLIVFPGSLVPAAVYNSRLRQSTEGLLPAEVGTVRATPANGPHWALQPSGSLHPLALMADALPADMLDAIRFNTLVELKPEPRATTILQAALSNEKVPLLVEKTLGAGSVLLFATSANRSWSDFPIHPLYPMLIQQAINHLLSARGGSAEAETGSGLAIPAATMGTGMDLWVRTPKGGEESVKVTETPTGKYAVAPADEPGFYEVALTRGGDTTQTLAVNIPSGEGDVRVAGRLELERHEEELGLRLLPPERDILLAIKESRVGRELWRVLMVSALIIFFLQAWLSRYFTRRQKEQELDVADIVQQADILAARKV